MTNEISNSDDIIDSRDVIARIEELETLKLDWEAAKEQKTFDVEFSEEDADELKVLLALQEEAKGYAPDWRHGATLIRDSYFVDYCEELLKDIGDLPKDIPGYIEIDWKKTADNIKVDYTSVEFGDVTYWVR